MAELPNNLELWNQVCETDPKHTKQVDQRGGYTTVDPQYQLKIATELWGPYGGAWKLSELKWSIIEGTDALKPSMTLDATFVYPGGAFEIGADMPYRHNDDCRKKLLTAARSKALSLLGFNADIFLGMYDDERYVQEMQTKHADEDELRHKVFSSIRTAKSQKILASCRKRVKDLRGNGAINKSLYDEALQLIEQQQRCFDNGTPSLKEQEQIRQQELIS